MDASKTPYDEHLQILPTKEVAALYALPDFDETDRASYLSLSAPEYEVMQGLRGLSSRVFFILQLGYFKAKHLFFLFDFQTRRLDVDFVLRKYFPKDSSAELKLVSKPTRLHQRKLICDLLGYTFFDLAMLDQIQTQATVFARRYSHAVYMFRSLLDYFHHKKIILPAYSFLQRQIISPVLRAEQQRLEQLMDTCLTKEEGALLDALLEKPEDGMYPFTQLQKEPSSFKYYQIRTQLQYAVQLKPIYKIVLRLSKQTAASHALSLDISHENIRYYGQLAQDHTPFQLQQLKSSMRYVYLLCFAYNRYRWINDILVEALKYNVLGLEKSATAFATQCIHTYQLQAHRSLAKVPRVLALLQDSTLSDALAFGRVRQLAFAILSGEEIDLVTDLITQNKPDKKRLMGRFYQENSRLISLYLRPIATHFDLDNAAKCDDIVEAIHFIKQQTDTGKSLAKVAQDDFPIAFLSKKQKQYVINASNGQEEQIDIPKYEMALYQALRNKIEAGDIFVSDSFKNRSFEQDLIDKNKWDANKTNIIQALDLPKLNKSIEQLLKEWKALLEPLYKRVNERIEKGLNPSIQLDGKHKDGTPKWHLIYTQVSSPLNHAIYQQFAPIDIAKLLQLVDEHTQFLSAFTHLFPSDVDGQKYYTQIPTINSRYSPKYFGLAKGIASLTIVADNIPVNADIIGANEHESHYVFDLLYHNDTRLKPDVHSTDSHGINQLNFAILDMFGYRFAPRYKDISSKVKTIYSFQQPSNYQEYVIKPIRKFNEDLIKQEWDAIQRIIVSLAQKHTSQSTIVKKLSSFKRNNSVRKAVVEYNAIVETYHKLSYIDDPTFQKQIHTALNRGEHINKLRKHIFHANGGKFKVHTVMEQKIWSECNRLLANAVIYYNTWLLSELLQHCQSQDKLTQVELIKKVSPIAWQHIHIHGRYTFKIGKLIFDVKKMVENVHI